MPNIRKPREYDAIKAAKIAEALVMGRSLGDAIESVDWSFADHYRLIEQEKSYHSIINHALRDRSRQLLEKTLEIEEQLSNLDNSASSTDVNAARVRADILKTVALAYDKTLSPTNSPDDEEKEGLVALLKRMQSESDSGVAKQLGSSPLSKGMSYLESDDKTKH